MGTPTSPSKPIVQVVSNNPESTFIVGPDGQLIKGVTAFVVRGGVNDNTTVDLEMIGTRVDIKGEVGDVGLMCPCCGLIVEHQCQTETLKDT